MVKPAGEYNLRHEDDCRFVRKTIQFLDALSDELPRERARYLAHLVWEAKKMASEAGCRVK